MKRPVELSSQANADVQELLEYHSGIFPHLGDQFYADFTGSNEGIESFPEAWPEIGSHGVRRKLLKQFPYAILYEIRPEKIVLLRVFHTSRRPGSWR